MAQGFYFIIHDAWVIRQLLDEQTNRQTNRRTDEPTNRRTDEQTYHEDESEDGAAGGEVGEVVLSGARVQKGLQHAHSHAQEEHRGARHQLLRAPPLVALAVQQVDDNPALVAAPITALAAPSDAAAPQGVPVVRPHHAAATVVASEKRGRRVERPVRREGHTRGTEVVFRRRRRVGRRRGRRRRRGHRRRRVVLFARLARRDGGQWR